MQRPLQVVVMCLPHENLHFSLTNQSIQTVCTDLGTVLLIGLCDYNPNKTQS